MRLPASVRAISSMALIIDSIEAHSSATSSASPALSPEENASSARPRRRVIGVRRSCAMLSEMVRRSVTTVSVSATIALNPSTRASISRPLPTRGTRTV